jgi:hypothetical protein
MGGDVTSVRTCRTAPKTATAWRDTSPRRTIIGRQNNRSSIIVVGIRYLILSRAIDRQACPIICNCNLIPRDPIIGRLVDIARLASTSPGQTELVGRRLVLARARNCDYTPSIFECYQRKTVSGIITAVYIPKGRAGKCLILPVCGYRDPNP